MANAPESGPFSRPAGRRARWQTIAAGLVFTALAVLAAWQPPRILQNLDGRIYDVFLRHVPHLPPGTTPVVVDIDEESLARYGQWPWPRYRVAQLLERVRDLGAAAIALDIVFPEPDRTSLPLLARERERDLGVPVSLGAPPGPGLDNDQRLAAALETGPFVLGYAFDFGAAKPPGTCLLHPIALKRSESGGSRVRLTDAPNVVCNLPPLARAAGASGFFNVAPDQDGTLRGVPLLIEHGGEVYPSLALAALLRARGEAVGGLVSAPGSGPRLVVGGRAVPIDERGAMLVRFRGPGRSYASFPAAAVLEGRVPAGALAGRIAVVGATAAGLKELRATPFDPIYPGPEVHAAVLDTLIQGDFLQRPRAARGGELFAALLAGTLATVVLARSGAIAGLPVLLLGSAALWGGAGWLFWRAGVFVSPLVPQAVLTGAFALLFFLRFRQGEREAAAFSRKLALTQDVIIRSMAALAETRDNETGGHIQRTSHYVKVLAEQLRHHERFREFLDPQTIELLYRLAPLHDIGKVGVRDNILLKPERLTETEFEEMKHHTTYGDTTLEMAERHLGDDSFLRIAREFALTHQEKWDGSGYPNKLAGEQIPIAGRLMAVADVYDALVSRRSYKEPLSHEEASAVLVKGRGTHFDPDVLDAFLAQQAQFKAIAGQFADAAPEPHLLRPGTAPPQP